MDELLRRFGASGIALWRFLEKNELFDAVMGVVGVLAVCRAGAGLRFLSEDPCSCRAAILAAVGVLRGPRVMGGSRSGWRFFLDWATFPFLSKSSVVFWPALRVLDFRWI